MYGCIIKSLNLLSNACVDLNCMIETSLDLSWKFILVIFENLCLCFEIFGNCLEIFVWPSEIFLKTFGNFPKVVGNLQKIVKNNVISMLNKQNNTCKLLTSRYGSSLCVLKLTYHSFLLLLVRYYWVEHSKKNSISMCTHVLFSINLTNFSKLTPSLKQNSHGLIWTFDCYSR